MDPGGAGGRPQSHSCKMLSLPHTATPSGGSSWPCGLGPGAGVWGLLPCEAQLPPNSIGLGLCRPQALPPEPSSHAGSCLSLELWFASPGVWTHPETLLHAGLGPGATETTTGQAPMRGAVGAVTRVSQYWRGHSASLWGAVPRSSLGKRESHRCQGKGTKHAQVSGR